MPSDRPAAVREEGKTMDAATLADGREIVGRMTPGPYEVGGPYPGTSVIVCIDGGSTHPDHAEPPTYEAVAILDQRIEGTPDPESQANASGIVWLRNHADELLAAAERGLAYAAGPPAEVVAGAKDLLEAAELHPWFSGSMLAVAKWVLSQTPKEAE